MPTSTAEMDTLLPVRKKINLNALYTALMVPTDYPT